MTKHNDITFSLARIGDIANTAKRRFTEGDDKRLELQLKAIEERIATVRRLVEEVREEEGYPRREVVLDLERPVLIHICRDKTLSYRTRDEEIFNNVALPVFSVENEEEAEALLLMVGRKQYNDHPQMPGRPWYKITLDGALDFKQHLNLTDLDAVADKLNAAYERIKGRSK